MIVGYKRVSSVEQKFDRQDLGDIENYQLLLHVRRRQQ